MQDYNNEYIKVKDKNYLFRDSNSEGIVNGDHEGYKKYIENYTRKIKESEKINSLEYELNHIKNDIDEIKTLLRNLINEPR